MSNKTFSVRVIETTTWEIEVKASSSETAEIVAQHALSESQHMGQLIEHTLQPDGASEA